MPEPLPAPMPEPLPLPDPGPLPVPEPMPAPSLPTTMDAETVRGRWPEVLQTLRSLRLATWVLVSQNAQVTEVTGDVVTLAFSTPQLATTFRTGPHPGNVQRALHETLGLDVRIETALGAGATAAPTAGATSPGPTATSPEQAAASWDAPLPAEPPADTEPGPADDGARSGRARLGVGGGLGGQWGVPGSSRLLGRRCCGAGAPLSPRPRARSRSARPGRASRAAHAGRCPD